MNYYNFKLLLHPTWYPICCGKTIVIPQGAVGVEIAYRASHLTRKDPESSKIIPLNVYRYRGKIYHA